jgi:hypothetical protein
LNPGFSIKLYKGSLYRSLTASTTDALDMLCSWKLNQESKHASNEYIKPGKTNC